MFFDAHELHCLRQRELFLTRRRVDERVRGLMAEAAAQCAAHLLARQAELALPAGLRLDDWKITRGENYQGLPYLMLDGPRHFQRGEVLAFRCFFWWGEGCIVQFHWEGPSYEARRAHWAAPWSLLLPGDWLCHAADPWRHDLAESRPAPDWPADELAAYFRQGPRLKVQSPMPFEDMGLLPGRWSAFVWRWLSGLCPAG